MPKRSDIKTILVLGAGPIVIGQACEFDYAGTQGCLALKKEGFRIVLVNSNPATIMTDPEVADATYIEPMTLEAVAAIIRKERPDALLPTLGGQTALNLALQLHDEGVLADYGIKLIGADAGAIRKAEDRNQFHCCLQKIGIDLPHSFFARNWPEACQGLSLMQFPVLLRPSYTLGGSGCLIAESIGEVEDAFHTNGPLFITEALLGWKEFELEVIRDKNDNCIVVCAIENVDPLGIHTGDSITVTPCMTLTDKEFQRMRGIAFAVIREVGVETGGANVQFAVHPRTGKMVVVEMNPRVSRSSALASKATGYPIAKIAALLAVGYTLDELQHTLLGNQVPASFEPVLDYVVVKLPCFQFEKFSKNCMQLGPRMHSVGEVMGIGRSFSEALLKAMRSLDAPTPCTFTLTPCPGRLWHLFTAFRQGMDIEQVQAQTGIDPWFLHEIRHIVQQESCPIFSPETLHKLKRIGFSDAQIGDFFHKDEREVRKVRHEWGIRPVYKRIDSTGAEFETETAYMYATYEQYCEAKPTNSSKKVVIVGSGANRIGQGLEFDYACVHAAQALKEMGYEAILINCNPETVSTDAEIADRLYVSPLTVEDILQIIELEKPLGVLLQFGGQTPLNLANELEANEVMLLGLTSPLITCTEQRHEFRAFLEKLQLKAPECSLQFPVIVRPSFVLGGRGVFLAEDSTMLSGICLDTCVIERFIPNAIEVDVDAVTDARTVFIPALMEQLEPAGVHSGDSASCIPPRHLSEDVTAEILRQTEKIALALKIKGLVNIQFAIHEGHVYVLEVNPRASRSLPFLSKALGIDLVRLAVRCTVGIPLDVTSCKIPACFFVKEAVLPYSHFPDLVLGPEMKSTGEVMAIGKTFEDAYAKAQVAAGYAKHTLSYSSVCSLQDIAIQFD